MSATDCSTARREVLLRLLLVEDDDRLAGLLAPRLRDAGYAVEHCRTAESARLALEVCDYAAVILDLGLPDADGATVLAHLRGTAAGTPVLILTSRSQIDDRVAGLRAGADDYLVKPFAFDELLARIEALLRRPGALLGKCSALANLAFDHSAREVSIDGQGVALTARDLDLLEILVRRAGKVIQRQHLESQLYGLEDSLGSNALDVLVYRLRRRLAALGARIEIHTIRGVGFMVMACD